MNYIKKLEHNCKVYEAELMEHSMIVKDLREYLLSKKFRCGDELDGYVSIQDVLNRLRDIQ